MAFRVFLSHSSQERDLATRFKEFLERPGGLVFDQALQLNRWQSSIQVFCFEYDLPPGANIDEHILSNLQSTDYFILLLSRNSAGSPYVNQEVGIAVEKRIPILPVALEPIPPPGMIGRLNYLRLYEDHDKHTDWLKSHIAQLADRKLDRQVLGVTAAAIAFLLLSSGGKK